MERLQARKYCTMTAAAIQYLGPRDDANPATCRYQHASIQTITFAVTSRVYRDCASTMPVADVPLLTHRSMPVVKTEFYNANFLPARHIHSRCYNARQPTRSRDRLWWRDGKPQALSASPQEYSVPQHVQYRPACSHNAEFSSMMSSHISLHIAGGDIRRK